LCDRILLLAGGRIVAEGSAAELARRFSGESEVRYTRDGVSYVHSVADATGFVRELFAKYGTAIGDLEVRRATLRDVYLAMVREFESGQQTPATLVEVAE